MNGDDWLMMISNKVIIMIITMMGDDPDGDPDWLYKSTVAKISLTHKQQGQLLQPYGMFPIRYI